METYSVHYEVCFEETDAPLVYGLKETGSGTRARRLTSDHSEIAQLAMLYNRENVSLVHLADVVADFRRG